MNGEPEDERDEAYWLAWMRREDTPRLFIDGEDLEDTQEGDDEQDTRSPGLPWGPR